MTISREKIDQDIIYTSKNSYPCECEPLLNDQPLLHDWFEIFFIKAGDVGWFIDNEIYSTPPYSLVVFNSQEVHKLQIKSNKRFERMKLLFNPALVRQFEVEEYDPLSCFLNRSNGRRNIVSLSLQQSSKLLSLFERIGDASVSDSHEASLVRLITLLDILIFVNQIYEEAPAQSNTSFLSDKVTDLMTYIEGHLAGDLSLETLSAAHDISRYYMCRMFKKETGSTLHNYILYKRIAEAKKLMKDGMKIQQVSNMCGFGSTNRFSAAFQNVVGMTPRAYIKEVNQP